MGTCRAPNKAGGVGVQLRLAPLDEPRLRVEEVANLPRGRVTWSLSRDTEVDGARVK